MAAAQWSMEALTAPPQWSMEALAAPSEDANSVLAHWQGDLAVQVQAVEAEAAAGGRFRESDVTAVRELLEGRPLEDASLWAVLARLRAVYVVGPAACCGSEGWHHPPLPVLLPPSAVLAAAFNDAHPAPALVAGPNIDAAATITADTRLVLVPLHVDGSHWVLWVGLRLAGGAAREPWTLVVYDPLGSPAAGVVPVGQLEAVVRALRRASADLPRAAHLPLSRHVLLLHTACWPLAHQPARANTDCGAAVCMVAASLLAQHAAATADAGAAAAAVAVPADVGRPDIVLAKRLPAGLQAWLLARVQQVPLGLGARDGVAGHTAPADQRRLAMRATSLLLAQWLLATPDGPHQLTPPLQRDGVARWLFGVPPGTSPQDAEVAAALLACVRLPFQLLRVALQLHSTPPHTMLGLLHGPAMATLQHMLQPTMLPEAVWRAACAPRTWQLPLAPRPTPQDAAAAAAAAAPRAAAAAALQQVITGGRHIEEEGAEAAVDVELEVDEGEGEAGVLAAWREDSGWQGGSSNRKRSRRSGGTLP